MNTLKWRYVSSIPEIIKNKWLVIPETKVMNGSNSTVLDRERNLLEILLYCPDLSEPSHAIHWYEDDDEKNLLSHQLQTIDEFYRRNSIIEKNLLKDPIPIYEEAIGKWKCGDHDNYDIVAKNPKRLKKTSFSPKKGQSLKQAYEVILKSMDARQSHHRQCLAKITRNLYEAAIFEDIPPEDPIRKSFIHEWEQYLFGNRSEPMQLKKSGRWEQCQGINRYTAGRILSHLLNEFLASPNKRELGEAACILWILIYASKNVLHSNISLTSIASLTSKHLSSDHPFLELDSSHKLKISKGLHNLLLCLKGSGQGKRAHRLFENIGLDMTNLRRILHRISRELDINPPVLPASFLIFPHPYPGIRIKPAQNQIMQNPRQLIPHSLKSLREKIQNYLKNLLQSNSY